jgi:excisionase family DNA binding protein
MQRATLSTQTVEERVMEKLLTTGEAAKVANRSSEMIRAYERSGRLKAMRTQRGLRLFRASDVQKLALELGEKDEARMS